MIGKNIERIIKHWGMKQGGFANLFPKMNRFKVSSYVNKTSKPSVEFMIILQRLTGLGIEQLYLGEVTKEELPPAPLVDNLTALEKNYNKSYKAPQTIPELFDRVKGLERQMEKLKREVKALKTTKEGPADKK